MKWLSSLVLTLALLSPAGRAADKPAAPDKKEAATAKASFYPLKEDNLWLYKVGDNRMTYRVAGFDTINGVSCARIEMTVADNLIASEWIAERPNGLYRYRYGVSKDPKKKELTVSDARPPIRILKLPPREGDTWTVDSEIGGRKLKGTFKEGKEKVTVPFGTFNCVTVTSENVESGGMKLRFTYYFAENVGMVKQVVEVSGQQIVTELMQYVPARPKKTEKP